MRAACRRGSPARYLSGRRAPPSRAPRAPRAPSLRRGCALPSGYRGCPCAPALGSETHQTVRTGAQRQAKTWGFGAWASGLGLGCGGEGFLGSWGFVRRAAAPRCWRRSRVARGNGAKVGSRAADPSFAAPHPPHPPPPPPPRPPPPHPRPPQRWAATLRARRVRAAKKPQAARRLTRARWAHRPSAAAPPWVAAAALAGATRHARKHATKRCQCRRPFRTRTTRVPCLSRTSAGRTARGQSPCRARPQPPGWRWRRRRWRRWRRRPRRPRRPPWRHATSFCARWP